MEPSRGSNHSPRPLSVCASASHFLAAASFPSGKERERTPGMPVTLYRFPCPFRSVGMRVGLCLGSSRSGGPFLYQRSSMYPGTAAPVRSDVAHGLGAIVDDLAAVQLEPLPAGKEVVADGVHGGGELVDLQMGVDVDADDAAAFCYAHAYLARHRGVQDVLDPQRAARRVPRDDLVLPQLEPVGGRHQPFYLDVQLSYHGGEIFVFVDADSYRPAVFVDGRQSSGRQVGDGFVGDVQHAS